MSRPGDYADCDSCAFGDGCSQTVCDDCEEADQWEPADSEDDATFGSAVGSRKIVKIKRHRILEAA